MSAQVHDANVDKTDFGLKTEIGDRLVTQQRALDVHSAR